MIDIKARENELVITLKKEAIKHWLGINVCDYLVDEDGLVPKPGQFAKESGDTEPDQKAPVPEDSDEKGDRIDIFARGPHGIGGFLKDAEKGRKKIEEIRSWIKDNKFNYDNFCLYLSSRDNVGGFKLLYPPIGTKADGAPSIFYLAIRYYTYWLSDKDFVARDYKRFLLKQLGELGVKVELAKDILEGENIDPRNLPKGIGVSV